MWCDDFDMDLPAVFAGIEQWFRQPLAMWALCRPTGGKINGPAAWWGLGRRGRLGTLVFVQPFAPTYPRDEHGWVSVCGYTADDPWVLCTPWDLIRDEWVHGIDVVLCDQRRREPLGGLACSTWDRDFLTLMHHRRGHASYAPGVAADAGYRCLRRLWRCARELDRITDVLRGE